MEGEILSILIFRKISISSVYLILLYSDLDFFFFLDVQQEKVHNSIISGVEGFERSKLHRTETQEKVVLPNAEGIAPKKA